MQIYFFTHILTHKFIITKCNFVYKLDVYLKFRLVFKTFRDARIDEYYIRVLQVLKCANSCITAFPYLPQDIVAYCCTVECVSIDTNLALLLLDLSAFNSFLLIFTFTFIRYEYHSIDSLLL